MTTTTTDIGHKELPAGWKWVKLGDVCIKTSTVEPKLEPDKTFTYIDISSVDRDTKTIVNPQSVLGQDAPSRAKRLVLNKDVLVSTTRPNLNAVAIVPPSLDGQVCSTGFCVLRSDATINADYLFNFTKSRQFVEPLSGLVSGALYPAVTDKQVLSQLIPLPPLEEQKRIAGILNEQMAAVEEAKKAAQERLEAAKALPAAYLREVFPSSEDELPAGWKWVKLGDVIESALNGLYKPAEFYGSGTRILRMFNIGRLDGTWELARTDLIRLTADENKKYGLRSGDILLNRVNSPHLVGKCAVVDTTTEGSVFESMNMRLRVTSNAHAKFLVSYLHSRESRLQIGARLKQIVGQASLNRQDVNSIVIPLPTIEKQKSIVGKLDDKIAGVKLAEASIQQELDTIGAMPAALLRKAFSGNL